jgi:putative colanic acid biosynthesis acetyltransferase WcaF
MSSDLQKNFRLDYQDLSLFQLPVGFRGRAAWVVQLWWIVQASLFRWSPQFAYGWRNFLLRLFGAKIGSSTIIRPSATITYPWKLQLGDNVWIGDSVVLYTLGTICIGDNTVISQLCHLCAADHDFTSLTFPIRAKPILVGTQVWLASDVFVAPGVTIGDASVVGARSSVFRDLPAGMLCYGYPCVPVRSRIEAYQS